MAQMVPRAQSDSVAVLFIGITGVGKSSLINLITDSNVRRSASSKSCTKQISVFRMVGSNHILIDTPGMLDSNGIADNTTFAAILRRMADRSISKLKIVWCVRSGTGRMDDNTQKQAAFISSLRPNYPNIWRSVAIVERQPTFGGELQLDDGVYDAAKKYGCQIQSTDMRYIGVTCLSWLKDVKQKKAMRIFKANDMGATIFDENELRQAISTVITDLPFTAVLYLNTQCGKCNVRYDQRYPPNRCHAAAEQYHNDQYFDTYREHASDEMGTYALSAAGVAGGIGAFLGGTVGLIVAATATVETAGIAAPLAPSVVAACSAGTGAGAGAVGGALGAAVGSESYYHKCCELKKGSTGCVVKYSCCDQMVGKNVRLTNDCPRLCRQCHKQFPAQPCLACGDNVRHEPMQA